MSVKKWWSSKVFLCSGAAFLLTIGVFSFYFTDIDEIIFSRNNLLEEEEKECFEEESGCSAAPEKAGFVRQAIFKQFYRFCDHYQISDQNNWPVALNHLQDIDNFLLLGETGLPSGWKFVRFSEELTVFTYLGDLCAVCSEKKYLGFHEGKIAVFRGEPSEGILKNVLPFEAEEVYRAELEAGIPFTSEEEKKMLLENLTT